MGLGACPRSAAEPLGMYHNHSLCKLACWCFFLAQGNGGGGWSDRLFALERMALCLLEEREKQWAIMSDLQKV